VTTSTPTDTVTVQPTPTAAIGSDCTEPGATGTTADGATAYCTQLQYTNRYLWSVHQDVIPNPVVTSSPTTAPPTENESPVRVCMQETGHTRLRCAEEILRGNGGQ
jgi:serine/threonine-protein kinase